MSKQNNNVEDGDIRDRILLEIFFCALFQMNTALKNQNINNKNREWMETCKAYAEEVFLDLYQSVK